MDPVPKTVPAGLAAMSPRASMKPPTRHPVRRPDAPVGVKWSIGLALLSGRQRLANPTRFLPHRSFSSPVAGQGVFPPSDLWEPRRSGAREEEAGGRIRSPGVNESPIANGPVSPRVNRLCRTNGSRIRDRAPSAPGWRQPQRHLLKVGWAAMRIGVVQSSELVGLAPASASQRHPER